jgi:hypothetical protein
VVAVLAQLAVQEQQAQQIQAGAVAANIQVLVLLAAQVVQAL